MLASIRQDVERKEKDWNDEQRGRQTEVDTAFTQLSGELVKLEQELRGESLRLEELLQVKEKQVEALSKQMAMKEEDLKAEREHTQGVISSLRKRADEFSLFLKKAADLKRGDKEKGIVSVFEDAIKSYNRGDFESAKQKLTEIVKVQPDFTGAHQYLALCYLQLGDKAMAKKSAGAALELEPGNDELKSWIKTLE
jgi:Flp pilus assembly protein TadD